MVAVQGRVRSPDGDGSEVDTVEESSTLETGTEVRCYPSDAVGDQASVRLPQAPHGQRREERTVRPVEVDESLAGAARHLRTVTARLLGSAATAQGGEAGGAV